MGFFLSKDKQMHSQTACACRMSGIQAAADVYDLEWKFYKKWKGEIELKKINHVF